jgi:NAD(P)-dependent dehydrogenase (short-subunit alcohol dehydrogenase family)
MPDRTALVTGCSSGFGLGIANALAARGWSVLAGVRDPARVPPIAEGVRLVQLDVTDEAQVAQAVRGVERLDCLVNNAGYGLNGPFASYSSSQIRRQFDVNVVGAVLLAQQLLPALAAARGRIINISSVLGEVGLPMNSIYCATKFALEGWSESLRQELRPHGIQVALVEPGGFRTRFGSNLVWGERVLAAGSRDGLRLAAYQRMRAAMMSGRGNDPERVVRTVASLAEIERMPLRTRVGADAVAARWAKRLLPERLFLSSLSTFFERRLDAERDP